MSKISGKDLEFWFDGAEVPVISVNHENSVDQQESTDTATREPEKILRRFGLQVK